MRGEGDECSPVLWSFRLKEGTLAIVVLQILFVSNTVLYAYWPPWAGIPPSWETLPMENALLEQTLGTYLRHHCPTPLVRFPDQIRPHLPPGVPYYLFWGYVSTTT